MKTLPLNMHWTSMVMDDILMSKDMILSCILMQMKFNTPERMIPSQVKKMWRKEPTRTF